MVGQHGPVTEDKTPLDQALEVAIYAPIGFVLDARKMLPDLVERGRQQVNMAKMVGQFAVAHGQSTASARITRVQEQAEALLHEFGIGVPEPVAPPPAGPSVAGAPEGAGDEPVAPAAPVAQAGAGADALAISGYDSLAASQVIPRLDGLSADELEAVAAYERAHRGRKTILGKIAQLTGH